MNKYLKLSRLRIRIQIFNWESDCQTWKYTCLCWRLSRIVSQQKFYHGGRTKSVYMDTTSIPDIMLVESNEHFSINDPTSKSSPI